MAIVGITVSQDGESIQRLAVSTKVSIGETKKSPTGKTFPSKLDHFQFLRKSAASEWEKDPELTKHYSDACREFWIVLLDDDIDNVFRTEFAWWSTTEKKCSGDGRKAMRRTQEHPEGEDWTPCGEGCPELAKRICKPSGDLYFILAEFPRLGSVCRLHTTSYRSIRQIHSALEQIRQVTGGRLAGIRCKLVVRPDKSSFVDKDGTKKSTTIYALNIELAADDMRKMLGQMTQYARLFEQTRKLLGDGRKVEYDEEPEKVLAAEIAPEFYPEGEAEQEQSQAQPVVQQPQRKSAAAPAPQQTQATAAAKPNGNANGNVGGISAEQRKSFIKLCADAGWGNDQVKDILLTHYHIAGTSQIPTSRYEEICSAFKSGSVQNMPQPGQIDDSDLPESFWPEGEAPAR